MLNRSLEFTMKHVYIYFNEFPECIFQYLSNNSCSQGMLSLRSQWHILLIRRSQRQKDVFISLFKSVLETLSVFKAALKRYTAIKLVVYQYLLLFQTLKCAFVCIVTGQL